MNFLTNIVLTAILAFSTVPLKAQPNVPADSGVKAADPRVRNILEQEKIPYIITNKGNFAVEQKVGKAGRTQIIYISSETDKPQDTEWREIYTYGQRVAATVDPKLAQKLLNSNARLVLGAWEIDQEPGKAGYAVFSVKVPVGPSSEALVDAIDVSASVADALEKETTGKDEF
jgi:hypothetical protein